MSADRRTRTWLEKPSAAWITHGLTIAMLAAFYALVVFAPFWIAVLPGVLLAHRIGIMGHEYIHGIPLKRYRHCQWVITALDGMMLMFGVLELYRGMHLAHHRWLNGDGDGAFEHHRATRERALHVSGSLFGSGEVAKHVKQLVAGLRGEHPYAKAERIKYGVAASLAWIVFWVALGRPDVVWKTAAIVALAAAIPSSLRAAIEHYSYPGDPGFANEYRVLLSLFNLNKHVHHHLEPRLPWYRLEFKTAEPLGYRHYFTHWYHLHIERDFVIMQPMKAAQPNADDVGDASAGRSQPPAANASSWPASRSKAASGSSG